VVGFPVHEFAHAFAAYRLGDNTARLFGRLTLNPVVHLDPMGAIVLVASAFFGPFFIGWAKPTPVNPAMLRGGRGEAIVAAAGQLLHGRGGAIVRIFFLPKAMNPDPVRGAVSPGSCDQHLPLHLQPRSHPDKRVLFAFLPAHGLAVRPAERGILILLVVCSCRQRPSGARIGPLMDLVSGGRVGRRLDQHVAAGSAVGEPRWPMADAAQLTSSMPCPRQMSSTA
jgi:hypothetical protein